MEDPYIWIIYGMKYQMFPFSSNRMWGPIRLMTEVQDFYVHFKVLSTCTWLQESIMLCSVIVLVTLVLFTGRGSELLYEAGGKTERGI